MRSKLKYNNSSRDASGLSHQISLKIPQYRNNLKLQLIINVLRNYIKSYIHALIFFIKRHEENVNMWRTLYVLMNMSDGIIIS